MTSRSTSITARKNRRQASRHWRVEILGSIISDNMSRYVLEIISTPISLNDSRKKNTTNTKTVALINNLEDLSFFLVVVVVMVFTVFNSFLFWLACTWQLCHFLLPTWKSDRKILSRTKLNVILLKKASGTNTKLACSCLLKYSQRFFFFFWKKLVIFF